MEQTLVVLRACPDEEAERRVAETRVEEHLAARVNRIIALPVSMGSVQYLNSVATEVL